MSRPELSVVCPTRDRRESVCRTVEALARQTLAPDTFEVIVVADGCSDDTVSRLRATTPPFPLVVHEQPPLGQACARNAGAARATAPILAFVDDDIEATPPLLEAHLRAHRQHPGHLVLGCSPPGLASESSLFHVALRNWWHDHIQSVRRAGHRFTYRDMHSGNFSISASLFAQANGFDTSFAGRSCEDYELGARLVAMGVPFVLAEDAVGYHHDVTDLDRSLRRARLEGRGDVLLGLRHPALRAGLPLARLRWPRSRFVRRLRDLAFHRPAVGDRVAAALRAVLAPLQAARLRGRFRALYGMVRTYWYCRGAAEELGRAGSAWERFFDIEAPEPELLDLDLGDGLRQAERILDERRPAGARVRLRATAVGVIPAEPGAEGLRGTHLRPLLAHHMARGLLTAVAWESTRDTSTWERVFEDNPSPVQARAVQAGISVLVAADGDAEALASTLESLDSGGKGTWEVLVAGGPDPGDVLADRSDRVRVVPAPGGAAAAWNAAVTAATQDWVVCLRAGDRICPRAMEAAREAIEKDLGAEILLARWRVQGRDVANGYPHSGDLFHVLAAYPAFPVQAALLRRERVPLVGGFDERMRFWPGWDLLQRLARSGARFTATRALVADLARPAYTSDTLRMRLLEALEIVRSGHGADPRLGPRQDAHPAGAPATIERGARINLGAWAAGVSIALGEGPEWVVSLLEGPRHPIVAPADVAHRLARGMTEVDRGVHPRDAHDLEAARRFVDRLEQLSGTPDLARRSAVVLERVLVGEHPGCDPVTFGLTHGITWDITTPPRDLPLDRKIERLHCALTLGGHPVGSVDLPVSDGEVSAGVLADAAAAAHGWRILGEFFARTRYPRLAAGPPEGADLFAAWSEFHDQRGWEVLLQEVWGRPDWPAARFYEEERVGAQRVVHDEWVWVEASEPLVDLVTSRDSIGVGLTVGGAPIATARLVPRRGIVSGGRVRSTLMQEAGLELMHAAVREGLLGARWDSSERLRDRLRRRASPTPARTDWTVLAPSCLAPGWERAATAALGDGCGIVLPRHRGPARLTTASRRARIPWSAADEIRGMTEACAEPRVEAAQRGSEPPRIVYAPALLRSATEAATSRGDSGGRPAPTGYDRHYFESLFATSPDPWGYETPYERLKYEQTLQMVPDEVGRALEVGCAEGRFTLSLAARARELVAADISEIALERTARRCAGLSNVRVLGLDLFRDPLPGPFDLVVCSEVLYFAADRSQLRAAGEKLAAALAPGGHLLVAHANVLGDGDARLGLDWAVPFGAHGIGATLAEGPGLRLAHELRTDSYRIQLFRRVDTDAAETDRGTEASVVEHAAQAPAAPRVAAAFRTAGQRPRDSPRGRPETRQLPILMYHHVSQPLPGTPREFLVTPEAFERQMAYLHEAGFYSTDLGTWAEAAAAKQPLPGRAVVLTFDDGYQDFADCAWPILDRHGFRPIVLLITDAVGGEYALDFGADHPSPLMGWKAIRDLQDRGVSFGSHSTTHRPLTALPPSEVVRDTARSRATLARALGTDATCFAYPYGDTDAVVEHLVGAVGFPFGLSTRPGRNGPAEPLLRLRRIEVSGFDSIDRFIARMAEHA